MPNTIRILGLDPGLNTTGWGLLEAVDDQPVGVLWGKIQPNPKLSFTDRLACLYTKLTEVIQQHRPDEAAVEETFVNQNPASALKLGMARGVVLLAPANHHLLVASYGANQVKKTVVGAGHASKEQIIYMISTFFGLQPDVLSPDEADALAVALCHLQRRRVAGLLR